MNSEFYNLLQLDPSLIKKEISSTDKSSRKVYLYTAMVTRSVLIVASAILFISLLSYFFGTENTPYAVVLFCMILGIRFVNFNYCSGDSLIILAAVMFILLTVPCVISCISPYIALPLHFAAFYALLFMTSQQPEMGNGGLYSFAYIYLTGNPVTGEIFSQRAMMAIVGYIICAVIFLRKHKNCHSKSRFITAVRQHSFSSHITLWHLRMAIAVSIILSVGQLLDIERFMWMGFACASLLSEYPYNTKPIQRLKERISGALAGSLLFYFLYSILPLKLRFILGPAGGFCLGFCCNYRNKTLVNCFGALWIATGIYDLKHAVILRISDTIAGAVFAFLFAYIFQLVLYLYKEPIAEKNNLY